MGISISNIKDAFSLIPLIVSSVKMVEKLFRKDPAKTPEENNKERQDAAVESVGDLLPLLEGAIERDVVDDALVQTALRKAIDAIVALHNVVRDVKAKKAEAVGVPTTPGS